MVMRYVVGRETGDGDIEIDRVDAFSEHPLLDALFKKIAQGVDQMPVHFLDNLGPLDVLSPMEIFGGKEPPEFGMLHPDRHQQQCEFADTREGIHLAIDELALALPDRLICCLYC